MIGRLHRIEFRIFKAFTFTHWHSKTEVTELFDTGPKPREIFGAFILQCPSIMGSPQPSFPVAYVTLRIPLPYTL